MRNQKKFVLLPGVAALIVGGVIACSPATTSAPKPAQSSTSAPAAAPPTATLPAAPVAPPAPPAPSTPSMTAGQQQAVTSAQGYLSDGEGFSRDSLIQQLTSSYGDGFTQAQAEYGVAQAGL